MSTPRTGAMKETERVVAGPGPGRGPFGGGMVGQKLRDFCPTMPPPNGPRPGPGPWTTRSVSFI